ncbi:hypothetical protein JCM3765_005209 [Sporobolomyces pararoseus]
MSFNRLPHEILQLIVDKCAEADRAYNDRNGEQEIKTVQNSRDKRVGAKNDLKGKSCVAVSAVSKALRSMSVKYVFTSLRSSRVHNETFKYLILGSSLSRDITKFQFDDSRNLLEIILHVLPRLPNLRAISGLNPIHLQLPFNSNSPESAFDEAWHNPVSSLAKKTFLELAKQITDWSIGLEPNDLETLLNANIAGIQHLRLTDDTCSLSRILDSPDSRYPSILARLPNLLSLSIHQYGGLGEEDDFTTSIEDFVFETPFSFATSLRSLELELLVDLDMIKTDIKFATLFTSLRRLVLDFSTRGAWWKAEEETFSLPNLEYFEIKNIPVRCISPLLSDLELPSIVELHLVSISIEEGEGEAEDEDEDEEDQENPPLEPISFVNLSTLRLIKISATENLNRSIIAHLSHPSVNLELDFETRMQLDTSCFDLRPSSSSPSPASQPLTLSASASSHVESGDPFYEETDRLLKWARSKAESMRSRDLSGSRELLKALTTFKEYVDWSEM